MRAVTFSYERTGEVVDAKWWFTPRSFIRLDNREGR
jgi:hypothetical protein